MKRSLYTIGLAAALTVACCGGCKKGDGGATGGDDAGATSAANGGAATPSDAGADALQKGDWTRAVDAFAEAIAANPNDADAYYGRAAASVALAEERYELAKAASTNEDVAKGKEEAAKADEYFKAVCADCDKALELDPNYADAYFLRGVVAAYQGDWNAGLDAFTKCVELDPNRAEAYQRRGEIYDHTGDYMSATVDYKKAAELGYRGPSADESGNADASADDGAAADSNESAE